MVTRVIHSQTRRKERQALSRLILDKMMFALNLARFVLNKVNILLKNQYLKAIQKNVFNRFRKTSSEKAKN